MSLLKSLINNLRQQATGQRTWTPLEIRELVQRKAIVQAREALEGLPEQLPDREAVRSCLLGEVLFQQQDDEGALQAFTSALSLCPGMPEAHYGLSLSMAEAGELEDGLRHAFFAQSVDPNNARFLAQVGYCQLRLKNHTLAEAPLRRAALLAPRDATIWNNLGIVLLEKRNLDEAYDCFRHATKLAPGFTAASENLRALTADLEAALGHPLSQLEPRQATAKQSDQPMDDRFRAIHAFEHNGELQAAIDACEALLLEAPDDGHVVLEAQRLYTRAGDPASAVDALEAYLSRQPTDTTASAALGKVKLDLQEFASAEPLLREAVEAHPDDGPSSFALALAISGQNRFAEASPWFDRAVELMPDQIMVRAARVTALVNECRYDEALQACEALLAKGLRAPSFGVVLCCLGRFDEALHSLNQSVAAYPGDPQVRWARASVRLLRLDFGGWEDYAYRGLSSGENFRVLPVPHWRGGPLHGKRILVLAEQGLGDQVMFASCLPDLLALRPEKVIIEAIDRIAPTIARSFPECEVIPTNQGRQIEWFKDRRDIDCYVPLGDLPGHFRRTLSSFPSHAGYLVPSADRVAYWRMRLAEAGPGPYIGFSWKGGTETTRTTLRTVDAMAFEPLSRACAGTWVCLQYGKVKDQVDRARADGFDVTYWPESIQNLDDFAALVSALDLVITVCNTTVHYAGALGRDVWIVAPKVPEWRYGLDNKTLPWYPTSVMFRQHEAGYWSAVFEEVRQELSAWRPAAATPM